MWWAGQAFTRAIQEHETRSVAGLHLENQVLPQSLTLSSSGTSHAPDRHHG